MLRGSVQGGHSMPVVTLGRGNRPEFERATIMGERCRFLFIGWIFVSKNQLFENRNALAGNPNVKFFLKSFFITYTYP